VGVIGISIFAAVSARAISVTLENVIPYGIVNLTIPGYSGGVYAGVYLLNVNGVLTPSFCIDTGREVSLGQSASDFSYASLQASPLMPDGPMGTTAAADVEKLWAAYYSPSMTGAQAAGLQVAIWEVVAQGAGTLCTVNGNDYGASLLIASLTNLTVEARLEALDSPSFQNYVVAAPDSGTTVTLFGLALCGLAVVQRKLQFR
jgi:hypothetical protein